MTGEQFRDCVERALMGSAHRYDWAMVNPEDLGELMSSWAMSAGLAGYDLYGYRLVGNPDVGRGEVVFHSPSCAGVYRVRAA